MTDVVPLADTDARGIGLGSSVLPLVIGGLLGGILATLALQGRARRIVALVAYAVVAGAAITGILQGWFGILQGSYLVNAAAVGAHAARRRSHRARAGVGHRAARAWRSAP